MKYSLIKRTKKKFNNTVLQGLEIISNPTLDDLVITFFNNLVVIDENNTWGSCADWTYTDDIIECNPEDINQFTDDDIALLYQDMGKKIRSVTLKELLKEKIEYFKNTGIWEDSK